MVIAALARNAQPTHSELAEATGLSPSRVNVILHELRNEGMVDFTDGAHLVERQYSVTKLRNGRSVSVIHFEVEE